jgi:hypothetical protein
MPTNSQAKNRARTRRKLIVISPIVAAIAVTWTSLPITPVKDHLASPKSYAKRLYMRQGGNTHQWSCLERLWTMESNWRVEAQGSKTTQGKAFGIAQALPADKMAQMGSDYKSNYQTQIRWGLLYIKLHWNNDSCLALRHEIRKGWY